MNTKTFTIETNTGESTQWSQLNLPNEWVKRLNEIGKTSHTIPKQMCKNVKDFLNRTDASHLYDVQIKTFDFNKRLITFVVTQGSDSPPRNRILLEGVDLTTMRQHSQEMESIIHELQEKYQDDKDTFIKLQMLFSSNRLIQSGLE